MIQHFHQVKMSLCNDLFHKSSLFSKSFKVFHCSVINVLSPSSAVSLSDSLFIIAPLSSFVNNFFHLFSEIFLRSSARKPSSCISVSIQCLPSHQRQLCYIITFRNFCQQLFSFILQYNQKSPITAQKLIIYKCLLHKQILSERVSHTQYIYFSVAFLPGWEGAAENFLRRKNCYSFCNSGKTFI